MPWAGVHTIEFRSPAGCCFVERVEIGPERPLPPDSIIARKLKWRPARLRHDRSPTRGAHDGARSASRLRGDRGPRPGEEIDVPFSADDDASKEIEISAAAGDAFASERLRVRAGQRLKHVVKLRAGGN